CCRASSFWKLFAWSCRKPVSPTRSTSGSGGPDCVRAAGPSATPTMRTSSALVRRSSLVQPASEGGRRSESTIRRLCGCALTMRTVKLALPLLPAAATLVQAEDLPRMTRLADGVYCYEHVDPTKRGVTVNNLVVITTDGVLVADGQGTVENTKEL